MIYLAALLLAAFGAGVAVTAIVLVCTTPLPSVQDLTPGLREASDRWLRMMERKGSAGMSVREISVSIDLDSVIVKDEEGFSVLGVQCGGELEQDRLKALYENHTTPAHQELPSGGCAGTGIVSAEVHASEEDPGWVTLRLVSAPRVGEHETVVLASVRMRRATASRLGDTLEFASRLPEEED